MFNELPAPQPPKLCCVSLLTLFKLKPSLLVSRCKKWDVPIEKIYNKTQREKFAWAIDMAEEDYEF